MRWTLAAVVLAFFLLAVLAPGSTAQQRRGTAVLFDVSGSMKRIEGTQWPGDVQRTASDLLFGGNLDEGIWKIDGTSDKAFTDSLRQGLKPLFEVGAHLLVMQYGEMRGPEPYFGTVEMRGFTDLNQARDFLTRHSPRKFNDQWTYTMLARAVARNKMVHEANTRRWYLIEFSDTDEDIPPKSAHTQPLVDSVAHAYPTTVMERVLVCAAYRPDRFLKMRITEVTYSVAPTPEELPPPDHAEPDLPPPPLVKEIHLREPGVGERVPRVDEDDMLPFRWDSVDGIRRYTLTLYDGEGEVVWRQTTSRPRATCAENLPSGSYVWGVEGRLTQGGRAVSPQREFEVKRGGFPFGAFLLIAAVVAALLLIARQIRRRRRERM